MFLEFFFAHAHKTALEDRRQRNFGWIEGGVCFCIGVERHGNRSALLFHALVVLLTQPLLADGTENGYTVARTLMSCEYHFSVEAHISDACVACERRALSL
jgi:hypothetical protein